MSIINSQPRIGAAGQSTGFKIERSLRFNSADSAYLNRTPASAGNRKTWTWSGWVKRSKLSGSFYFFCGNSAASNAGFFGINFEGNDRIEVTGWTTVWRSTSAQYRDPSAWYHVVVALDTTQATADNRVRLYVNGSEVTAFATKNNPTQNDDLGVNTAAAHYISSYDGTNSDFDGYITEVNFIDGYALTPASFGANDSATGVWGPRQYTGPYGTNGFYLNFSDNSNTTSTTLGKDYSGNGNNWTPNNFSVTAGAGNDSLVDTPTPYGTDTGAGGEVRGNYCTLNPINSNNATFANGNLETTVSGGSSNVAVGTVGVSSGKWYWEVVGTSGTAYMIGISDASAAITSSSYLSANGWAYYVNGEKYNNSTGGSYGASYTTNDVIGVALDMDAGTLVFYKNGSSQGTAYSTGISGKTIVPMIGNGTSSPSQGYIANFGARPFAYTAPSGFKALCTQNLPTPTIGATATTRADDYFNTVLYTGTGSSLSVTGVGFQPDFVWIKERAGAADHGLYDAVRGVQKQLESNTTTAETTETTGLTAFGTDGFTVGALAQLNTNTDTYVAWNWKANGAGVSNTDGTITSTVSANTTAGISIVSFATGSNTGSQTIGHGLGVAPSLIISKVTTTADDWLVYHSSLGTGFSLRLNTTAAALSNSTQFWGSTFNSTVFSGFFGSGNWFLANNTYVAYCFAPIAGYSAFGSYTGNGSADGPFVYVGFRPRFIILKNTTTAGNAWHMIDTARGTYNVYGPSLDANASSAEITYTICDVLSNGFKFRDTNQAWNKSGDTYIYMSFAEVPQKFSLAR